MKTATISAKEIRGNLEGFLRKVRQGQTVRVIYRSKPYVTVCAVGDTGQHTRDDAGTPAAARRSIAFVKSLPSQKPKLNPNKSFKELYEETQKL